MLKDSKLLLTVIIVFYCFGIYLSHLESKTKVLTEIVYRDHKLESMVFKTIEYRTPLTDDVIILLQNRDEMEKLKHASTTVELNVVTDIHLIYDNTSRTYAIKDVFLNQGVK